MISPIPPGRPAFIRISRRCYLRQRHRRRSLQGGTATGQAREDEEKKRNGMRWKSWPHIFHPTSVRQSGVDGISFTVHPGRLPSAPGVGLPVATAHPADIVGAAAQSWPPPRAPQALGHVRSPVCWPMQGRRRPSRSLPSARPPRRPDCQKHRSTPRRQAGLENLSLPATSVAFIGVGNRCR